MTIAFADRRAFSDFVVNIIFLVIKAKRQELNSSRRASGYTTKSLTRLHLPLAIVVSLHVRKINVVIFTPETAGTFGESVDVARSALQEAQYLAGVIDLLN